LIKMHRLRILPARARSFLEPDAPNLRGDEMVSTSTLPWWGSSIAETVVSSSDWSRKVHSLVGKIARAVNVSRRKMIVHGTSSPADCVIALIFHLALSSFAPRGKTSVSNVTADQDTEVDFVWSTSRLTLSRFDYQMTVNCRLLDGIGECGYLA
jgi:hypothetical protein